VLRRTIEEELKHPGFMDMLLESKLAKEGDKVTRPLYYDSKAWFLCKEFSEIMNEEAYMRGLRDLNIFELLIGHYDPRVLLVKMAPKDWRARSPTTETTYFRSLKELEQQSDPEHDRFRVEYLEIGPSSFKIKRR